MIAVLAGIGLALSLGILTKRFFDIGVGWSNGVEGKRGLSRIWGGIKGMKDPFVDFFQDLFLMLAAAWLCSIMATPSASGLATAAVGIYSSYMISKKKKERLYK